MKKDLAILFLLHMLLLWPALAATAQVERAGLPSHPADSLRRQTLATDSLVTDSTKTPYKDALEAPVTFSSKDSIVFERGGFAHLYGDAKVNYQRIELTSAIITMNLDSSTVFARGIITDSITKKMEGRPVFKDGDTPYETDRIRYNFKSRRAYISNVSSQQGEGYVIGKDAKKGPNDELYMSTGMYTTCDHHDHPHFYIKMTRSKVRPGKNVVAGPVYLVIEDVPTPLALPFIFFPFSKSFSSGILMPSYSDDSQRGFGLINGGYYFAISDLMDAEVRGDIFTKGSFALRGNVNYARRYKYSGTFQASYQVTKTGDKNMDDYSVSKDFKVVWNHRQDQKASPNSSFSAAVNFSTSSFERQNIENIYNPSLQAQNTKTSNIAYSRSFPDLNLTLSGTFNIAQRMQDSTIAMTLPDLNIAVSRIYPFKRKNRVGSEKWYEKINMSYSGRITNSITSKDTEIFQKSLIRDYKNGMQNQIPINATFSLFNNINITPSINYQMRVYTKKEDAEWDDTRNQWSTQRDTLTGLYLLHNMSASVSMNTKLYGMYKPLFMRSKNIQIRHVFTPEVSFSYTPDMSAPYYKAHHYKDVNGDDKTSYFSYFGQQPFGSVSQGKSGSVNFRVSNNIEMKMLKGTGDSAVYVKTSLIDELGAGISYNMMAKQQPWSDLNATLRLKLPNNRSFSMNSTFATYAWEIGPDGRPRKSNRTEWSFGRFGRWQGYNWSFNQSLNNDTFKKWFGKKEKDDDKTSKDASINKDVAQVEPQTDDDSTAPTKRVEKAEAGADGYQAFKMPWSFNINYGVTIREDSSKPFDMKKMRYPYALTHTLNCSGNVSLSNKWKLNFNSGYDFKAKEITQTTFTISRDLHCFTMNATFSPFGRYKTYHFTISATAQVLRDLKWEQRSGTYNNIRWY